MKDYTKFFSCTTQEKEKFIKSYKIKNNNLIIYYSTSTKKIPYSSAKEQKIIDTMHNQIITYKEKADLEINTSMHALLASIGLFGLIGTSFYISANSFDDTSLTLATISLSTLCAVTSSRHSINAILEDIKKQTFLLEHYENLNKIKNKEEYFTNVNYKVKQQIKKSLSNNEKPFTLKTIDKYPLFELKIINTNIHQNKVDDSFNKYYSLN